MATSRPNDVPLPSDARGFLIPDDIVRYKDYVKSHPTTFFSSNNFFVRATQNAYRNPKTDQSITKYLSAIPDQHFRLIKGLRLDYGFYSPAIPGCLCRADWFEYFERIIGNILIRGGEDLVINIQYCDEIGPCAMTSFDNYRGYKAVVQLDNFWECFKDHFRKQGYNVDRIKIVAIQKFKCVKGPIIPLGDDNDSDTSSCGTLDEDGVGWNYALLNEYENEIFEIDPISKDFVWDVWEKPIMRNGGRKLVDWKFTEL